MRKNCEKMSHQKDAIKQGVQHTATTSTLSYGGLLLSSSSQQSNVTGNNNNNKSKLSLRKRRRERRERMERRQQQQEGCGGDNAAIMTKTKKKKVAGSGCCNSILKKKENDNEKDKTITVDELVDKLMSDDIDATICCGKDKKQENLVVNEQNNKQQIDHNAIQDDKISKKINTNERINEEKQQKTNDTTAVDNTTTRSTRLQKSSKKEEKNQGNSNGHNNDETQEEGNRTLDTSTSDTRDATFTTTTTPQHLRQNNNDTTPSTKTLSSPTVNSTNTITTVGTSAAIASTIIAPLIFSSQDCQTSPINPSPAALPQEKSLPRIEEEEPEIENNSNRNENTKRYFMNDKVDEQQKDRTTGIKSPSSLSSLSTLSKEKKVDSTNGESSNSNATDLKNTGKDDSYIIDVDVSGDDDCCAGGKTNEKSYTGSSLSRSLDDNASTKSTDKQKNDEVVGYNRDSKKQVKAVASNTTSIPSFSQYKHEEPKRNKISKSSIAEAGDSCSIPKTNKPQSKPDNDSAEGNIEPKQAKGETRIKTPLRFKRKRQEKQRQRHQQQYQKQQKNDSEDPNIVNLYKSRKEENEKKRNVGGGSSRTNTANVPIPSFTPVMTGSSSNNNSSDEDEKEGKLESKKDSNNVIVEIDSSDNEDEQDRLEMTTSTTKGVKKQINTVRNIKINEKTNGRSGSAEENEKDENKENEKSRKLADPQQQEQIQQDARDAAVVVRCEKNDANGISKELAISSSVVAVSEGKEGDTEEIIDFVLLEDKAEQKDTDKAMPSSMHNENDELVLCDQRKTEIDHQLNDEEDDDTLPSPAFVRRKTLNIDTTVHDSAASTAAGNETKTNRNLALSLDMESSATSTRATVTDNISASRPLSVAQLSTMDNKTNNAADKRVSLTRIAKKKDGHRKKNKKDPLSKVDRDFNGETYRENKKTNKKGGGTSAQNALCLSTDDDGDMIDDKKSHDGENDDDDDFEIPRAKIIADNEKKLDLDHADLLRRLSKKPSQLHNQQQKQQQQQQPLRGKRKGSKKGKPCALCSTCSCTRTSLMKSLKEDDKIISPNNTVLDSFARSDAEMERALLGRLARLEKSAAWFDHLRYKVGRELKKHRSKINKRRLEVSPLAFADGGEGRSSSSRFLADVDVDDRVLRQRLDQSLSKQKVAEAQRRLFARRKKVQPTLTQMINPSKDISANSDNDDGVEDVSDSSCQQQSINSDVDKEEREGGIGNQGTDQSDDENPSDVYEEGSAGIAFDKTDSFQNRNDTEQKDPLEDFYRAQSRRRERFGDGGCGSGTLVPVADGVADPFFLPGIWAAATTRVGKKLNERKNPTEEKDVNCSIDRENDLELDIDPSDNWRNEEQTSNKWDIFVDRAISSIKSNDEDDAGALNELLGMFERTSDGDNAVEVVDNDDSLMELVSDVPLPPCFQAVAATTSTTAAPTSADDMVQLTQRGQSIADTIENTIKNDPSRMRLIEEGCPNWKENIQFALCQRDESTLYGALKNVGCARDKLKNAKQKIMRSWKRREYVLELYELSLVESLKRVRSDGSKSAVGQVGLEEHAGDKGSDCGYHRNDDIEKDNKSNTDDDVNVNEINGHSSEKEKNPVDLHNRALRGSNDVESKVICPPQPAGVGSPAKEEKDGSSIEEIGVAPFAEERNACQKELHGVPGSCSQGEVEKNSTLANLGVEQLRKDDKIESMTTAEMKATMTKYGFKPASRTEMARRLRLVYQELGDLGTNEATFEEAHSACHSTIVEIDAHDNIDSCDEPTVRGSQAEVKKDGHDCTPENDSAVGGVMQTVLVEGSGSDIGRTTDQSDLGAIEQMSVEELKSKMVEYGFKTMPKRKMIDQPKAVRRELQAGDIAPCEVQCDSSASGTLQEDSLPSKQHPNPIKPAKSTSRVEPRKESGNYKDNEETLLHEQCAQVLREDRSLRLLLLDHRTIQLSQVQGAMSDAGVLVSKKQLSSFLDKHGVQFNVPWRQQKPRKE